MAVCSRITDPSSPEQRKAVLASCSQEASHCDLGNLLRRSEDG